jgi:hypothetical protein
MAQDFTQPQAVSQYLLDETGQAYVENDFDRFAACFLLPQHVATYDGTHELRTVEDLRVMFDRMLGFLEQKGATHLDRRCVLAEFQGPDVVRAIHETRFMAGDKVIETAFPAFSILKRIDGNWQVSFSQYAVDQDHARALGTFDAAPVPNSGETL